ncbi:hypothetical protein ZYGR_0A05000 [Zygosaccharomyces rouxii]|uniref:Agglutinin-like protein N-terminal domain-containing protein n=1 Tax=Zygosaccharomyces rouxii TaxID=4956 RepID=A0A1Q2ZTQ8_ZYGRO|nr:hypothetical protein ZYGR_0A05000 [Zygosaccharomyces rouxii]
MYKTFNSIRSILFLLCLAWHTFAKEINGVSFSGLKFTPLSSLHYPHQGWSASFDFEIENGSSVSKGDYFTLNFPTVYRIKFDDNKLTTNATLQDGSEAFECFAAQQAAYKNEDTVFKCVAILGLSSYSSLSGSLSFGLSFSSGGSSYEYEMQNADKFHSGTMQVSLADQLSASVEFDSANFTKDIYTIGRSTTFNSLESYYLGMSCPNGYLLGGTQTINYDRENKGYDLDCSSVQVYLSDQFNDWSLPLKGDNANAKVDCSDDTLKVNMNEAKPNQKLWINALQDVSAGVNTIQHEVHLQYSCSDTEQKTTYSTQFSTVVEYTIYQASDSGTLSGLTATSASSSSPVVTTPTITSTITTGWTGTYNTTYSTGSTELSGSGDVPTEEIIYYVETPSESSVPQTTTTTTTTGWTGTYTTTYSTGSTELSGSTGAPTEEIIYYVETPSETVTPQTTTTTTTNIWSGSYTTTYSTESTSLYFSTGVPMEEVIIYVETPESKVAPSSSTPQSKTTVTSTTTTGWTGKYNSTYSTASTILVGSTGIPTEEIIYYFETPETQLFNTSSTPAPSSSTTIGIVTTTTTTTTGWTGTYTTTYLTASTSLGGNTGTLTEEIIYYVETPNTTVFPPPSTSVTSKANITSSTSQISSTSWSSKVNLTSSTPHLVTLSTTDLNSTYLTTCDCSESVPTINWSSSSTSNTITSVPPSETSYVPQSSSASVSKSSLNITSTSSPSASIQSISTLPSPTSSDVFNSTISPSLPVSSFSTLSTSSAQNSINSTHVTTTTPTAETFFSTTANSTGSNYLTSSRPISTSSVETTSVTNSTSVPPAITSNPIITSPWVTATATTLQSRTEASSTSVGNFSSTTSAATLTPTTEASSTIIADSSTTPVTSVAIPSSTSATLSTDSATTSTSPIIPIAASSSSSSSSSSAPSSGFSSAAAVSTTPSPSSSGGRFSLGLSLDQGSIAQIPIAQSSTPCSTSTKISTATVTVTKNSTTTKHVTAPVTHTVTQKVSDCHCPVESHQSSLEPYFNNNSSDTGPSIAPYSGQGLVLKRGNSITALIGVLLFIL